MNSADPEIRIGRTVRTLRKSKRITIVQLAGDSCLSPNTISLIESDKVSPTLTTLWKIASALQVPIGSFFTDLCPAEIIIRRLGQAGSAQSQNTLPALAAVDALLSENASTEAQMILCLNGHVHLQTLTAEYDLNSGDYVSCLGRVLHCCQNLSDQTSILIWIIPGKQSSEVSPGNA
ncbi:MAG: helix-turn-helix domain-containing protein [Anaerolineales bacterium]|jgi:transcriptional regulator with XRE-family HTH domain